MSDPLTLDRARALLETKRYEDALGELQMPLTKEPADGTALCLSARAFLGLGQPEQALAAARAAASAQPDDVWPLRLMTIALTRLHRRPEAVSVADAAIKLAPDDWNTYAQRALIDIERRKATPATWEMARAAVRIAPNEPQAHLLLGNVAMTDHDLAQADESFRAAQRLDPEGYRAQNALAALHLRRDPIGRAISEFSRAVRLGPAPKSVPRNLYFAVGGLLRQVAIICGLAWIFALAPAFAPLDESARRRTLLVLLGILLVTLVSYCWHVRRVVGQPSLAFVWRVIWRRAWPLLWSVVLVAGMASFCGTIVFAPSTSKQCAVAMLCCLFVSLICGGAIRAIRFLNGAS
ncbi:MAG: tetratricopeptide repeat protein [Actinomycetia bacterium]|nr:tetratricopeptide repeat protein [Actinomycetes bacterium]